MIVKDTQIQIRINATVKAKAKYLAEIRGYKGLSDYICYLMIKDISESELSLLDFYYYPCNHL